jgi:YD repeat-containing protein
MTCDAVGNVTSVTDARGNTTTTTYDALRRKTAETGPAGTNIQTLFIYDLNGDQTETRQWDSTAATWRSTVTTYSATHKPLTVTDPALDVTRTCYDAVDRPVMVIDGERRATRTVYNAAGQPTEIQRFQRAAAGSCTVSTELPANAGFTETRWRRFLYNAGGLQSAEIDARGNTTSQVYDGLGRPARTIYPNATQAWTAMDERGQAVFRKQRSGHRASVFYDAVGRDTHVREHSLANAPYMWTGRNTRA